MESVKYHTRKSIIFPTLMAWRSAHQLKQSHAAEFLGISQTLYSRLERGTRTIKGPLAKRISEQTRVPLAHLVGAE